MTIISHEHVLRTLGMQTLGRGCGSSRGSYNQITKGKLSEGWRAVLPRLNVRKAIYRD